MFSCLLSRQIWRNAGVNHSERRISTEASGDGVIPALAMEMNVLAHGGLIASLRDGRVADSQFVFILHASEKSEGRQLQETPHWAQTKTGCHSEENGNLFCIH